MLTKRLVYKEAFFSWLDSLRNDYRLLGPAGREGQTVFREISSSGELSMGYTSTMLSPGKLFIYKPKEELFTFRTGKEIFIDSPPLPEEKQMIVGVHPCDTNAILYLDRTFLGGYRDPYYEARRKNSFIISLNCSTASQNCFCSSVGSGPFLKEGEGCDILLTDFDDMYLAENMSKRAEELFNIKGKKAGRKEMEIKSVKEKSVLATIEKTVDIIGLDRLFKENMNHPVWERTADERCLSCSNCVMVCPTCFCYNMADETSLDQSTGRRLRQLDACHEIRFAEVSGGNFRQQRAARLRQFVTHKMNQTGQYGVIGTVGCGRCITWCPTGIDLTEMTKEIRKT